MTDFKDKVAAKLDDKGIKYERDVEVALHDVPPPIGHNSGDTSNERVRSFVERIEKLNEEKAAISEDIKEIFAEIKSSGFDAPAIRDLIRMRKQSVEDRLMREQLLELYKAAMGME